LTFHF